MDKMQFIITIDTEADNQWDHGCELTVDNIRYVPRFQDLCNKYLIKPTYLVTSEVCEDHFAREIFSEYSLAGTAEIGAHLHSWSTPPFLDKEGYRYNDENHAFANELPGDLVNQKIKNLTNLIEASFGKRPISFRSGRYGFNEIIAGLLKENKYLVDSSITPYTTWSAFKGIPGGKGGPDFLDKIPLPFKYDFAEGSLLEIPVTIVPTKFPLNRNRKMAEYYFRNVDNSFILKVIRRLLYSNQPLWLRPHLWMNNDLFDDLLKEASRIKLPCIVMIFHSSELMPGGSRYWGDEWAIEKLYDLLEQFFGMLQKKSISSVTLAEAAKSMLI